MNISSLEALAPELEPVKTFLTTVTDGDVRTSLVMTTALGRLRDAVLETRQQIAKFRHTGGAHSGQPTLVRFWTLASEAFQLLDGELAARCFRKADYWADPSLWGDGDVAAARITLDEMRDSLDALLTTQVSVLKSPQLAGHTTVGGFYIASVGGDLNIQATGDIVAGNKVISSATASVAETERHHRRVPAVTPRPDVLLVTVNEHETKAVHDAFFAATGIEGTPVSVGDRLYHDLGKVNDTVVYHAISEMGSGGSGGMQQTVEKAITALEPGAVIAVGIAFGVDEENQKIGEILVSKLLRLYDLQRIGKRSKIILRGARPDASPRLVSYFRTFQQVKWSGAKARFGVVLTGDKLIDNVDYRNQLLKFEADADGGEMEGAGLYVSSHENKVDWIVIKAICDFADGNKGVDKEARQKLAAKNAAEFVLEALRHAPLKR